MARPLDELRVLVLDGQSSGATPAYGDLLELAWGIVGPQGLEGPLTQRFVVPRTERRVTRAVRELTGWSEACLDAALSEDSVWAELDRDVQRLRTDTLAAPTVIHYARFELPFLRDLHTRLGAGEFALDVQCLHAISARLYPDLPRRNIRALAGFLGHTPELTRRAEGHVESSAFIWRALLPQLAAHGVHDWDELARFLAAPAPKKSKKRSYPLSLATRRALPDAPGVYRFLRSNGDVLYVGKATNLKKRIAGHFRSGGKPTERALELLTQVHDITHDVTPSTLEAALLESDAIKTLDPPYNVQLRTQDRCAWFARADFSDAAPAADESFSVGPLPSRRAASALWALTRLVQGEDSPTLRAVALAVPSALLPDDTLFAEGFAGFVADLPGGALEGTQRGLLSAGHTLWLTRRRSEPEISDELPPDSWDLARVRRRLDRNLIQAALLVRRARFLCLLADADVAFRESDMTSARVLTIARCEIVARAGLSTVEELVELPARPVGTRAARRASFDAAHYDRLRVLVTELARVQSEGGSLALRIGKHLLTGERLAQLLRSF